MKIIMKLVGILAILFALSACAELGIYDGRYEGSVTVKDDNVTINNDGTIKITIVKTDVTCEIVFDGDFKKYNRAFTGTITGKTVFFDDSDDVATIYNNEIKGSLGDENIAFGYTAKKK